MKGCEYLIDNYNRKMKLAHILCLFSMKNKIDSSEDIDMDRKRGYPEAFVLLLSGRMRHITSKVSG